MAISENRDAGFGENFPLNFHEMKGHQVFLRVTNGPKFSRYKRIVHQNTSMY